MTVPSDSGTIQSKLIRQLLQGLIYLFDLKEHLRSLVDAHAPSGHEAPVREIVRESWANLVDEYDQDKLGSLIGIKKATNPLAKPRKIMLAAHMDEM